MIRSGSAIALGLSETGFLRALRFGTKYFREKPGFSPPVRQCSETGFLRALRFGTKYFREKPGFWALVRQIVRNLVFVAAAV
ncbi:hypothetical protein [Microcoleus sp. bin38.metabat.b11b12b14.051]|uniref:hypothetical protein n=1 Tax=Microcoleus sp. bin38.metabat.b11b12b14.051 TaxID=2742709 RepID=UPI0025D07E0D|nr:hypothetical protein [Microcoleus sp. bin38.metabat.b11b12b14.051]